MEQHLKVLNEGFMRKYLKEAEEFEKEVETSEEEDDSIDVGDLFLNGDETFKLLDINMDEDGNVIVDAEDPETGESEEIEYVPAEEEIEPEDEIESDEDSEELTEGEIGKKVGRVAGGFVGHPEIGSKVGDVIEDKGIQLAKRKFDKFKKDNNIDNDDDAAIELAKRGGKAAAKYAKVGAEKFKTGATKLGSTAGKIADAAKSRLSKPIIPQPLTVECVNKRKIMEKLNSLREAQMSPEDEHDTEILRNIVNKSIKRKNAKLTPEEQYVLAKYGLYRNDWGEVKKDLGKNSPFLDPEIVNPNELNYSFQGRTRTRTGYDSRKDKVNLADRARKMNDRGAGYEANRVWAPTDRSREFKRSGEDRYTRLKGKGLLDKERALQNTNMQGNYLSMQQALKDRKFYQNSLDNIDSNADAEIAKLRSRIDAINKRRESDRKYDSDAVSRQQSKINKLLRKEESLSEDLLDSDVSDFNSDVYNALSKVMFKWDRKDIQPSQEDMDNAYEWFSTHFYGSDDWY